MSKLDQLTHALKLAREDLWFLMCNVPVPEQFIWRTAATAEFITQNLGDSLDFNKYRDRWLQEGEIEDDQRKMVREYLIKIADRYKARPRCERTFSGWDADETEIAQCDLEENHGEKHESTQIITWFEL